MKISTLIQQLQLINQDWEVSIQDRDYEGYNLDAIVIDTKYKQVILVDQNIHNLSSTEVIIYRE